jgi:recombinational DNA repair protein (RecF pathway)
MQEYITKALVLDREESGDLDYRLSLFSKRYGKVKARVKSVRKITSKLAGHLDVGSLAEVRMVEKNGLQVVDALKLSYTPLSPPHSHFLDQLLHENDPDSALWYAATLRPIQWIHVLRLLGWDPKEARCVSCQGESPCFFMVKTQEFLCESCNATLKTGVYGLLYLHY